MAQSSISSFFAVRRKRTDGHGTAKRRKLEDGKKQPISRVDEEKAPDLKLVAPPSPRPTKPALLAPSTPSKSPARAKTTTSEFSPQLKKFETFEVESPTKKNPRYCTSSVLYSPTVLLLLLCLLQCHSQAHI